MKAITINDFWYDDDDAKRVDWTCPHCGSHHIWYWNSWDIEWGRIKMKCDKCGRESDHLMFIDSLGNGKCESSTMNPITTEKNKKVTISELEQKIKNLQEQLEELKNEEEQKKNITLDDLIIKWEFGYSERIERESKNNQKLSISGLIAMNDFYYDEINRLVTMIEEWLPEPWTDSSDNIEYRLGYNRALLDIKSKLRNENSLFNSKKND